MKTKTEEDERLFRLKVARERDIKIQAFFGCCGLAFILFVAMFCLFVIAYAVCSLFFK